MVWALIAVVLGAALVGAVIGYILGRVTSGRVVLILTLAGLGGMGLMLFLGRQQTGFDGLGYVLPAVLVLGPLALGCGGGGLLAGFARRREAAMADRLSDP